MDRWKVGNPLGLASKVQTSEKFVDEGNETSPGRLAVTWRCGMRPYTSMLFEFRSNNDPPECEDAAFLCGNLINLHGRLCVNSNARKRFANSLMICLRSASSEQHSIHSDQDGCKDHAVVVPRWVRAEKMGARQRR